MEGNQIHFFYILDFLVGILQLDQLPTIHSGGIQWAFKLAKSTIKRLLFKGSIFGIILSIISSQKVDNSVRGVSQKSLSMLGKVKERRPWRPATEVRSQSHQAIQLIFKRLCSLGGKYRIEIVPSRFNRGPNSVRMCIVWKTKLSDLGAK